MLIPLGIAWIGLFASDQERLVAFYRDIVGLRVIETDENCCIFDAGHGALFEVWGKGLAQPSQKSPKEQSMIVGFLVERLEPVVEGLRFKGLISDTQIDAYLGTRWIYFTDPEGNRFVLKDNLG